MDDFKKQIMLRMLNILEQESDHEQRIIEQRESSDSKALTVVDDKKMPVPVRAVELRKLSDLRLVEIADHGRTLELISGGTEGIPVKEVANILAHLSPDMGEKSLFSFLRRVGEFYIEDGHNLPYKGLIPRFYRVEWRVNHQSTGPAKYAIIRVTALGVDRIRKFYEKYGIINLAD